MGKVDPDDDQIWRWVIEHHRFDHARREFRPVVVVAYDNAREFERELDHYAARVRREIEAGTRSRREWVGGRQLQPGYRAQQARAHMVRRAIEHGADPRRLLDSGPLPSNMAVCAIDEAGSTLSDGERESPAPPSEPLA